MARLETQINQIFLLHPQSKKISLVLHEEKLGGSSHHLFLLAELKDDYKKINPNDLKNISEIILLTFRTNPTLPTTVIFETSLSEINQRLADIAAKQSKSWLGKFSSMIALKSNDAIYLAGSGAVISYLVRDSRAQEIWASEKRGNHPLKIYQNFISGKLLPNDELIIATSSIFNFISAELFNKVVCRQPIEAAAKTFSKILQDSAAPNSGFASFLIGFRKEKPPLPTTEAEILLPQQEELKKQPRNKAWARLLKPIRLVRPTEGPERSRGVRAIAFIKPLQSLLANRSPAGKFFLTSFLIFVLLLSLNLTALSIASGIKKKQTRINEQASKLTESIAQAESALIYKDDEQASKFLTEAYQNHSLLKTLDEEKSQTFEQVIQDLSNKINRISIASNPQLVLELRSPPAFMTRAGSAFLFATEQNLVDLFLLNSIRGPIRAILHVPNFGNLVLSNNKIYRINEQQKLFEAALNIPNSDLYQLKFVGPNRLYTLDKNSNQILRITLNNQILSGPQAVLKSPIEFSTKGGSASGGKDIQDFGIDSDIYLLVSDGVKKFVGGKSIAFNLQTLSDPLTNAYRLQVGSNLYILESEKKRLLVFSKQGKIINQIYFPDALSLTHFYVDETARNIYLVDGKKLLKITF